MHRLTYGPVTIARVRRARGCIWMRLGNTTEIKVRQVHNQLSSSSHHLIVYKDDMDTTEQTRPSIASRSPAPQLDGMIARS